MNDHDGPRPLRTAAAFLCGVGLTFAFYAAVYVPPLCDTIVFRYTTGHPIEFATVGLFFWALADLGLKFLRHQREYRATHYHWLQHSGGPELPENAGPLIELVLSAPSRYVRSLVGRRLVAGLSFVRDRRAADGLDDHLVYLAELDAEQSHGSFALARLAAWMIPILGFLGTVIGITMAIANVTPAQLESSLDQVTGGLAVAFDTTALALCLSMALMFVMFVVERGEQRILRSVDRHVHTLLAHRFLAGDREVAPILRALASTSQMVVEHTEKLVEKQAELWRQTLTGWQARMETLQRRQDEQLEATRGLLLNEGKRSIDALRAEGAAQSEAIRSTAQRLDAVHAGLAKVAEQLNAIVQSSGQLGVLQSRLNQNLETLRATQSLDEAMHSLTAAIHLLTVRHAGRLEPPDKQAA